MAAEDPFNPEIQVGGWGWLGVVNGAEWVKRQLMLVAMLGLLIGTALLQVDCCTPG
jgi:hypothetical protein